MKKNINVLVLVIFFCSSCGFESLHSSKKPNFIIEDIILEEQDLISRAIYTNLKKLSISESKNLDKFTISVKSKKELIVTAKDNKGDPKNYVMRILVNLKFYNNKVLIKQKSFTEQINYKNRSNKFNLKLYEKNIEKDILKQINKSINLYILKT